MRRELEALGKLYGSLDDRPVPSPSQMEPGCTVELVNRPGERFGVVDITDRSLVLLEDAEGRRLKVGRLALRVPTGGEHGEG